MYKLLGLPLLIHPSDMCVGIETPGFVHTVVQNINRTDEERTPLKQCKICDYQVAQVYRLFVPVDS